jgi:glycosyltransferase involved in cell wall biosynthesis
MIERRGAAAEAPERPAAGADDSPGTAARLRMTVPDQAASAQVSVVVPALNEAGNLPHVLPRIPADVLEIIVVDGHSTDGTAEVARAMRPDVRIVRQRGSGKGDALVSGFAEARGDIIVTLDADGSAEPEEIPRFVDVLLRGADFAKGSRFLHGGGSADITRVRRLGNQALGTLVNLLFRTRYSDLCYGYNAFWARHVDHLDLDSDGFEIETLMNVRAAKAQLVVVEVPSFEHRRISGVSNLNAPRDGLRVLRTILRERFGARRRERRGRFIAVQVGRSGARR